MMSRSTNHGLSIALIALYLVGSAGLLDMTPNGVMREPVKFRDSKRRAMDVPSLTINLSLPARWTTEWG